MPVTAPTHALQWADLGPDVAALAQSLLTRRESLCTVESCTGGLLAGACTDLSGSSRWFDRGWITYSNDSKRELVGVTTALIAQYGAVSPEVAQAMALGGLRHSTHSHWAVALTGVAGPDGGSADKPVGTVCVAWAHRRAPGAAPTCQAHEDVQVLQLAGLDRQQVRWRSVQCALRGLIERTQRGG